MRLSGPGIGWVSWWWSIAVRSRQERSPRILIIPAPNSRRISSQRRNSIISCGGGTACEPSSPTSAPHSSSIDSQP